MKTISFVLVALLVAGTAAVVRGDAAPALDTADDSAYDAGWTNGSNGGYGFDPWSISINTTGGTFIGSSANNGGGSSGDIDTGGESWGLWSSTNGDVNVWRVFSNGTLAVGEVFEIDLDNGYIADGGSVGLGLQNSGGANLWEYYFVGGNSDYTINDNAGQWDSGIPWTEDGMSLSFQLTGATSYSVQVTAYFEGGISSTNYNFTGHLIGDSDQNIARFHLWSYQAGGGSAYDFFANSASVVPEPTTVTLLAGAGIALLAVRRRR